MRPLHMESCTFCFPTAPRAPPLESASARNRVRLRPHPRPKTCAEHRHTRSISTIMMVKRGLKPEVDSICRTGDSRSSIIVPSRSDAEAGVELALPMACRLDGNGRATAGNRGQMAASRAQKEIVAARNRGKWAEVLEVLNRWEARVDKLDAKTYNIALSALGKFGRWREAISILDRMRRIGVPPDVYSMNGAISACGRAGKWQRALDLLKEMEADSSRVKPDVCSYNSAISALATACVRSDQALALLTKMESRGLTPDVVSYASAMRACDRAGEWQRALDVMDTMRERNVVPNVVSYGTAISACARSGQWQKAVSLLSEMPSFGIMPNAVTYGSAVHACVMGGEARQALALLDEMMDRGISPDAAAFTAGMRAVDGWAAALRLLETMKRHGVMPDIVAYNVALSVVARCGRDDVALAMLERIRRDGLSPDLVSFNTAIDACAAKGNWFEAIRLLEEDMVDAKIKPDVVTFTSVIHACSGPAGNWEKAYQLLDRMYQSDNSARPNKNTYDLVIQACGYGEEWELAVSLLDDMVDLGMTLDTQTFNIAIAACARSGQWLAARTLAASMPNRGVAPDRFTYASVVAACARAGEWTQAKQVFDEARYVRHLPPSVQIYGALLSCLADYKQWSDVLLYLDRMAADGVPPDAAAIATGVLAAAQLGYGRRALSLLDGEKWVGHGVSTNALPGDPHAAAEAKAEDLGTDQPPVRDVGLPWKNAKRREASLDSAVKTNEEDGERESESTVGAGGWEEATPALLRVLLQALDGENEHLAVLETVKRARSKGVVLNSSIYRCALKACGKLGDCSQATSILAKMQGENLAPDIVHWNHALRSTQRCARWREARSYLRAMQAADILPDDFSYLMAIKACTAGLWSGSSWDKVDGWGNQDRDTSATPQPLPNFESKVEHHGEDTPRCRGEFALEAVSLRYHLPHSRLTKSPAQSGPILLLEEMGARGVHVGERFLSLAMAACLEAHRDCRVGGSQDSPPERDLWLSRRALSLFDRIPGTGVTPTSATYALAMKACARTADAPRASSLLLAMLNHQHTQSSAAKVSPSPPSAIRPSASATQHHADLAVRPWHVASAIAAHEAAGDWAGAVQLWEDVLDRGVAPRSPGYSAMIAAAARAGDLTTALRLMKDARLPLQSLQTRAFRSLVNLCEARGEQHMAAQLREDARSRKLLVK